MPERSKSMQKALEALKQAPKCGAHCRTTNQPCRNASMANGRCRMHGGKATGPRPRHGRSTKAARKRRSEIRALILNLNR